MELQHALREILRASPQTAGEAEYAREAADLLAAYLRLEDRVHRLLDDVASDKENRDGRADLRGRTLGDAAEAVLEDAGEPLYVKELGKRIKARGWTHPRSRNARPEQISFQLAARLPRDPRFRRVAPNTFGLAIWERQRARPQNRRPRLGLFSGPGEAVAQRLGGSDEHVTGEGAAWRSS